MAFIVYETASGAAVSVGTVVADPLPAGLAAVEVSAAEFVGIRDGVLRWDPVTIAVVVDEERAARDAAQAEREADRAELIDAAKTAVLARMDTLETQAAAFAAQPDATNNLTALNLINTLKNMVIPAIAAELVDAGRRDVQIVRLTIGDER